MNTRKKNQYSNSSGSETDASVSSYNSDFESEPEYDAFELDGDVVQYSEESKSASDKPLELTITFMQDGGLKVTPQGLPGEATFAQMLILTLFDDVNDGIRLNDDSKESVKSILVSKAMSAHIIERLKAEKDKFAITFNSSPTMTAEKRDFSDREHKLIIMIQRNGNLKIFPVGSFEDALYTQSLLLDMFKDFEDSIKLDWKCDRTVKSIFVSKEMSDGVIAILEAEKNKFTIEYRDQRKIFVSITLDDGLLINDFGDKRVPYQSTSILDDIIKMIAQKKDKKFLFHFMSDGFTIKQHANEITSIMIHPHYASLVMKLMDKYNPEVITLASGMIANLLVHQAEVTAEILPNGSLKLLMPEAEIENENNACLHLEALIANLQKRHPEFDHSCLYVTNYLGNSQPINVTSHGKVYSHLPHSIQQQTHFNAFTVVIKPEYAQAALESAQDIFSQLKLVDRKEKTKGEHTHHSLMHPGSLFLRGISKKDNDKGKEPISSNEKGHQL